MIAKRVVALALMAMISTISPAIYQKGLEPRLGALNAKIAINSFTYDIARSGKDVLCYKAWITVRNPNPYPVILSQLDLDMFFATTYQRGYDGQSLERYKKIGSFNTTQEYTIPAAASGLNVPESEWGAIASFDDSSHKEYSSDTNWGIVSRDTGRWTETPVFAYVYLSTQYEGNATEEAIAQLLALGTIEVNLQGDLIIGPLKMPFSLDHVELNLNIWGQIFTITDIVGAYQDGPSTGIAKNDVYYVEAEISNPSGNPFILKDYRFDLYAPVEGTTTLIALGIDSRYLDEDDLPGAAIYDPDINQTKVGFQESTRVPLRDIAWGTYDNLTQRWAKALPAIQFAPGQTKQNVIFGFNFTTNPNNLTTTKNNIAEFMQRILKDGIISDLSLRGTADIALGMIGGAGSLNGIEVNFGAPYDYATDPNRFKPVQPRISLTATEFYQKSETDPQNVEDRMQLGSFEVTKIDVNANTNQITLNATSSINFTNPYRIEMNFTQFGSAVDHDNGGDSFTSADLFSQGTDNRVIQLWRGYRTMLDPTALPLTNTTVIVTNVTIGYNTDNFDTGSGLGQIYKDIGFWDNGSLQLFNLTNPFHVLGPNGVKLEDENGAAPNWMNLVDYLISHQTDPLMLLHQVNTTGETYTGVDSLIMTKCSTLGTALYTNIGTIYEPEDFPSTNSILGGPSNYAKNYHTPFQFRTSWNQVPWTAYWNWEDHGLPSNGTGDGLKKNDPIKNQWVFAAAYGNGSGNYDFFNAQGLTGGMAYVPDWGYCKGLVWQKDNRINVTGGLLGPIDKFDGSRLYPELAAWRFDTASASYHGQFGYWYDFSNLEKGYYFTMQDPDWVLARQNVTIPTWMNSTDIQILKATLSMSYRYPYGQTDNDVAILGISNQTASYSPSSFPGVSQSTFQYHDGPSGNALLPGQTDFSDIDGARWFWSLPYPGSVDWASASYDVTSLVQMQLARMSSGNSKWVNASKLEVAFGKSSASGSGNYMMFDDIILRIEYKNMTKLSSISPYELFDYIEQKDPQQGNLWNMMDQLNFNATKFTAFLEGTLGHQSAPGASMNFIDFMSQSGAKPETMPNLLQNNYIDLGGSEPVNFLQMLNQTKYRAAQVWTAGAQPPQPTAPAAPYGPRDNNLANWVVEDPLKASQVLAQKLMDNLYTKSSGGFLGPSDGAAGDIAGEELWNMLDNLQVYLPWVCMYLVQHGWSKDDIFDLLEALGLGMNVRQSVTNYNPDTMGATGSLRVKTYMEIWVKINVVILGDIGPFSISSMAAPIVANFKLGMGETLRDPVTDLYFVLGAPGQTSMDVDGSGTTDANEYNVIPLQVSSATLPDPVPAYTFSSDRKYNPISLVNWIEITPQSKIGIKEYTLALWINGKQTSSSYAPPTVPQELWPYTAPGLGLTAAGCQQLFQNLRQNVKFQGETFLQTGGNPISLFQFLDDDFFLNAKDNNVNYSSYTLFNHYNMKGIDLVDILTDFNRTANGGAGAFDSLGDGICDEWSAPTSARYWEGGSSHYDYSLSGFGGNFRDNRLYKQTPQVPVAGACQKYSDDRTGTIIWTDSPSLTDTQGPEGTSHRQGYVYLGDPTKQDHFEKGAPPIVNLLDMFAWLSMITGKPDPQQLLQWLTGQLDNSYYTVIGNGGGTGRTTANATGPAQGVKKGLGYDNTWALFKNITMNATGMVNWMENVKFLSPFKFFYMMNQTDQAMDPLQLLFYATNQNWILRKDGSIAFVYHTALGTTNAMANNNLWKFLNSTWWRLNDPYGADPMFDLRPVDQGGTQTYATFPHLFYQKLRDLEDAGNGAYNLFVMMEALQVDPVSWLNILQWNYPIKPLELFAVYNTLNYDWAITNRTGGKSRVQVNCTAFLQVNGLNLNAVFNWALINRYLSANYIDSNGALVTGNLRYFLPGPGDVDNLYQNNYVYHPYSGIP